MQIVKVLDIPQRVAILAQHFYDEEGILADERILLYEDPVKLLRGGRDWAGKCISLVVTKILESKTRATKDYRVHRVLILEDSENYLPLDRELIVW